MAHAKFGGRSTKRFFIRCRSSPGLSATPFMRTHDALITRASAVAMRRMEKSLLELDGLAGRRTTKLVFIRCRSSSTLSATPFMRGHDLVLARDAPRRTP
ncbi:MAG: hypothetical protein DI536_18610 [Archangium gephyra]|uniref:Uncharacterized protein n=1 Tax=Archangium gephyra TaxID=48 RepID=A0A2W5UQ09_9BACT|nr:MAG: hypothetical protein DI536_18610 [Archangium gephyra]